VEPSALEETVDGETRVVRQRAHVLDPNHGREATGDNRSDPSACMRPAVPNLRLHGRTADPEDPNP
jgi:hypothetical protein